MKANRPVTRLNARAVGVRLLSSIAPLRLWQDQRGNALALTVVAMPIVLGAVGLAVDTTRWVLMRRQLQQGADSAAMSGSYTAIQGGDIDYAVDQDVTTHGLTFDRLSTRATLSPEGHDGDPYAVAVTLSAPAALPFVSLFMAKPLVSASATATVVQTSDFCGFALDPSSDIGIMVDRDATVESECGLATNSSSAQAIHVGPSSTVAAKKLMAFGGIAGAATNPGSKVRAYALQQKDPVADINPPEIPDTGCPNATINDDGGRAVSLAPGCYGNLAINGKVTLQAGNYVLNMGNMVLGPRAEVTCTGCTFFLTSRDADTAPGSIGRVTIDPGADVNLSAPTNGAYAGLLMYQDRRAAPDAKGAENVISGRSSAKLDGILYFPAQTLRLDGTSSPDFRCARIIGRKLILQGHLVIAKGCSADTGKVTLAGAEVRLVG